MKFSGVTRFTLLLATRAAVLLQTCGKKIEKSWLLPYGSASFYETLERVLRRHPYYPLKVLIDADVDVKRDELPQGSFSARRQIITRQRAAHFQDSFLSASFAEKAPLGGWHVVHMGLSHQGWLQDIFEALQTRSENRMEPLSFFAAEAPHYAAHLALQQGGGWRFLNILTESTGLRQIVLRDRRPVFTRLQADIYPSMPQEVLTAKLAEHIRAGRDYLPRLGLAASAMCPVQLFVPAALKDIMVDDVQLYALDAPAPGIVPPEWAADIAWLAMAAAQNHSAMSVEPAWLRQRHHSFLSRKLAMIALLCFGSAGVYTGVSLLTKPATQEEITPPALMLPAEPEPRVEAPPAPPPAPPDMKLEAVIYNNPQDWAVWIDGQKYVPQSETGGAVTVVDVSPGEVLVRWQQGETAKEIPLTLKTAATGLVR